MARGTIHPTGKYHPSKQSLDFAARIAELQGLPFDRDVTEKLGTNLYETMFDELIQVLNLEADTPDFHSGIYPSARAFSAITSDQSKAVALDMVFDFWVTSLTHIVAVCIFSTPSKDEQRRISSDVSRLFELFLYSGDFKRVREPISHYVLAAEYKDIIRISSLMGRATIVFILCHELAHLRLDHHREPGGPEQELEADKEAIRLYKQVVEHGRTDCNTHIHIDPKIMSAPLVFTMILELFEAWLQARGVDLSNGSHPRASERTAQLQQHLQNDLNEEALEIAVGATYAITDLHKLLGLLEPKV